MKEKQTVSDEKKNIAVAVVGGDLRQLEAAKALALKGYDVSVFGLDIVGEKNTSEGVKSSEKLSEALFGAELVLLPLPYSRDGINLNAPLSTSKIPLTTLVSQINHDQAIALGMADDNFPKGYRSFDYAESETFAIKNAWATVEGAIAIAIRETRVTLNGANILITGYGRIGKLLATTLRSFGANVTVVARKKTDFALAWTRGIASCDYSLLERLAEGADIIFNTVPSLVIDKNVVSRLSSSTVIIELASLPGGVDIRAVAERGINLITASGLPGKYSPKTAGVIIADCAEEFLLLIREERRKEKTK